MHGTLFYPKSVAVIGALRDSRKVGYATLNNLLKFWYKGSVYPVNPKADQILGIRLYSTENRGSGRKDPDQGAEEGAEVKKRLWKGNLIM